MLLPVTGDRPCGEQGVSRGSGDALERRFTMSVSEQTAPYA